MFRLRKKFRPRKFLYGAGLAAAIVLAFPILRSNLYKVAPMMQAAGERLALISALSDLPDQSKALLEKRFNDETFHEDEPDTTPLPNPNTPSPMPEGEPSSSSAPPEPESPPASAPETPSSSLAEDTPSLPRPDAPDIPKAYRGPMLEEDLSGYDSKTYLSLEPGYLRNYTEYTHTQIQEILEDTPELSVGGADAPQVLIYHTHATEAFERYDSLFYDTRNNWRSTDNNMNMVAVGAALAQSLEENGINVLHDDTQHDYPSYNGAYDRSAATVKKYLEKYPSIKILLDVHRDAIDRDGTLVRPIAPIDGKKAAQLMIIAGCDDGTMNMPDWRENLRFAASIQQQAEADTPRLMRPIFFCYRKYNLDKTPGSLLLEFGSHGNTLEECVYTAELVGKSIATAIKSYEE